MNTAYPLHFRSLAECRWFWYVWPRPCTTANNTSNFSVRTQTGLPAALLAATLKGFSRRMRRTTLSSRYVCSCLATVRCLNPEAPIFRVTSALWAIMITCRLSCHGSYKHIYADCLKLFQDSKAWIHANTGPTGLGPQGLSATWLDSWLPDCAV